MEDDIVAIGFAAVTALDDEPVVVMAVVVVVVDDVDEEDDNEFVEFPLADADVADVVVAIDDAVLLVVDGLLITVPDPLLVVVLIIADIGVVVLAGAAPGLKGVFCFCMLYIRLGQSVTRISRPKSSLPLK